MSALQATTGQAAPFHALASMFCSFFMPTLFPPAEAYESSLKNQRQALIDLGFQDPHIDRLLATLSQFIEQMPEQLKSAETSDSSLAAIIPTMLESPENKKAAFAFLTANFLQLLINVVQKCQQKKAGNEYFATSFLEECFPKIIKSMDLASLPEIPPLTDLFDDIERIVVALAFPKGKKDLIVPGSDNEFSTSILWQLVTWGIRLAIKEGAKIVTSWQHIDLLAGTCLTSKVDEKSAAPVPQAAPSLTDRIVKNFTDFYQDHEKELSDKAEQFPNFSQLAEKMTDVVVHPFPEASCLKPIITLLLLPNIKKVAAMTLLSPQDVVNTITKSLKPSQTSQEATRAPESLPKNSYTEIARDVACKAATYCVPYLLTQKRKQRIAHQIICLQRQLPREIVQMMILSQRQDASAIERQGE